MSWPRNSSAASMLRYAKHDVTCHVTRYQERFCSCKLHELVTILAMDEPQWNPDLVFMPPVVPYGIRLAPPIQRSQWHGYREAVRADL